jgi:hypothetical protein
MALTRQWYAKLAFAVLIVWCADIYYKINILRPISGLPNASDFAVYYHAGRDILSGISPYENAAYFYPPLVAFLMAPFALTDYVSARCIWFALSNGFLLLSAWLLWRAIGRDRVALGCIAIVWAFGGAAKETLDIGQLSPVLVLALVIAYSSRGELRGVFTGVGFALKYIPGVLVGSILLHRRWRELSAFLAVGLMGVVFPWIILGLAFSGARAPTSGHYWLGTPALFSWSIPSTTLRVLLPASRGATLPAEWQFGNVAALLHLSPSLQRISAGAGLLTLLAGLIALAVVCRGKLNAGQVPWAMAGLVSLSLAAAPVCWTHYQVLQYPGVAMLMASACRRKAWPAAAAAALFFGMTYRWPEAALNAYHDTYWAWTAASPATLYFWTSIPPLACLGLFGLALANVRRTVKQPGAERQPAILVLDQRRL